MIRKNSKYLDAGDLIVFYFALDCERCGIVIQKIKRSSGFVNNKKEVIIYQVMTSEGLMLINDQDWMIKKIN